MKKSVCWIWNWKNKVKSYGRRRVNWNTNGRNLRLWRSEFLLYSSWLLIKKEYPNIGGRACRVLTQFSSSYLRELGFSALVRIKTSTRGRLQLRMKCEYVYLNFVPVLKKHVNVTSSLFHVKCLPQLVLFELLFCTLLIKIRQKPSVYFSNILMLC
jgi:hypothetical protein